MRRPETIVAPAAAGGETVEQCRGQIFDLISTQSAAADGHRAWLLGRSIQWNQDPINRRREALQLALAERLDGSLITSDGRLVEASGPGCRFDLIT